MNYRTQAQIELNAELVNQSVTFRPLGKNTSTRGIATGRETADCIEVTYYEPITVLIPRNRVQKLSNVSTDSPLATSLTGKPQRKMSGKTFSPTGWTTMGSRGKLLFCHKAGRSTKTQALEGRQEEVFVYLLRKLRVPWEETVKLIPAFRAKPEPTLDGLAKRGIFTALHLQAVLEAEIVDWEVQAIIDKFGIVFE